MTSSARRALVLIYPPSFALGTTITGALAAMVSYPLALRRITRFRRRGPSAGTEPERSRE